MLGAIHNPHYYEYLRTRGATAGNLPIGRELNDIPCGGMPTAREMHISFGHSPPSSDLVTVRTILSAHRGIQHVQNVELRHVWPRPDPVDFASNRDLREQFLEGGLGEQEFARALQLREKRRAKRAAVHDVLAMMGNVGADTMRSLMISRCSAEASRSAFVELRALRHYANESMAAISTRFGCVVPIMRVDWTLESVRVATLKTAQGLKPASP